MVLAGHSRRLPLPFHLPSVVSGDDSGAGQAGIRGRTIGAGDKSAGAQQRHEPRAPPIRTLTVGAGIPPAQPLAREEPPGRGLSPPVRTFTDPGARSFRAPYQSLLGRSAR